MGTVGKFKNDLLQNIIILLLLTLQSLFRAFKPEKNYKLGMNTFSQFKNCKWCNLQIEF